MLHIFTKNTIRSDIAEGWYQDENGDWYQADPTEGKKPSSAQQSAGNYKYIGRYCMNFS